jgi:hypothetical protein
MRQRILPTLFAATLLVACGQDSPRSHESIEGLELTLTPIEHEGAECRIRQTARVDQDRHSLYMLRGETVYAGDESQTPRRIPLQLQFRGLEGIQTEYVTTLTGMDAPCSAVSINIEIEACIGQDRKTTPCPTVETQGASSFSDLSIETASD